MGILIDRTADCPYVNFSEEGLLEIEGRSITEDVFSFWQPLIDWVANYIKSPAKKTTLNIYLEYSNSSTNKYLNELLRKLEVIHKKGKSVDIIWRYEEDDESILTLGQDLEALTTIPLKMVPVEIEKNKTKRIKIKSKKSGNEALITFKYWEAIVRNGHGEEYIVLEEI
jgi:GTP:adenosylcobinamide-phosphate guanylyltransferase